MYFQDWTDAIYFSLDQVWAEVVAFIPLLLGAAIVFIIGLIVSSGLGHLVEKVLAASRIDTAFAKTGITKEFERTGIRFDISRFFGRLTYWFFLIVTILSVANILLGEGNNVFNLLEPILGYIGEVVKAILILIGTVLLANFLKHVVRASVLGARLHSSKMLAAIAWWAIVVFGFMAALIQLGIAVQVINTLVMGIIAMLALAGGIAFGLGGREYASHLLERFRDQMENGR